MKKTIIVFTTILALLNACRKLVCEDFPDADPSPVLNAILEEGQIIQLQLSYVGNVNGDSLALVQDALVIIKEGEQALDTLIYTEDGRYVSQLLAKEKTHYSCEAHFIDGSSLSAQCYLPQKQQILHYEHIKEAGKDEEGVIYPAVKVTFENSPEEVQYYQLLIKLLDEDSEDYFYNEERKEWEFNSTTKTISRSPELLNITDPLIVNEGLALPVFSNELIEGNSYTMTLNYSTGGSAYSDGITTTDYDPLVIELRSINYEYYRYIKQLYLYEQGRYPEVFGDVARVYPLYSNIANGYGIFAAYASCITDTIVVE